MTCDVTIKFISQAQNGSDEYGIAQTVTTERKIYAAKKAVKRNEFYQAQAAGIRPEIVFECFEFEYKGEKIVEHDGKQYNVIRAYPTGGERIEVICNDIAEVG